MQWRSEPTCDPHQQHGVVDKILAGIHCVNPQGEGVGQQLHRSASQQVPAQGWLQASEAGCAAEDLVCRLKQARLQRAQPTRRSASQAAELASRLH